MITIKKQKHIKRQTKINKNRLCKSKSKLQKNKKTLKNIYKQNGNGILDVISSQIYSNTGKRNLTSSGLPGSRFVKNSKNLMKSFIPNGNIKANDVFSIFYNYKSPYQITINNKTIKKTYNSSSVQSSPYIQMYDHNNLILVMILPGQKPRLMWALEFKYGSKSKTILNYLLPKFIEGQDYKLLFKLYRYPINIKEKFSVIDSNSPKRKKAFRKFQNYLNKNNMINSSIDFKEINVRQDKGSGIENIFDKLMK